MPPPLRAPFMAARPRGAGRRAGRAELGARPPRSPPPARTAVRPPPSLPGAARCGPGSRSYGQRAPAGRARGPEGAGRGALQLGWPGTARRSPRPGESETRGGGWRGRAEATSRSDGTAEVTLAAFSLSAPPDRPRAPPAGELGWEAMGARQGRGLSRDTCLLRLGVPPMGSQLRPAAKGHLPRTSSSGPRCGSYPRAPPGGPLPPHEAPALEWRRGPQGFMNLDEMTPVCNLAGTLF